jgi:TatD DNase family protein
MDIVDTHCHIHEAQPGLGGTDSTRAKWLKADKRDPDAMIADAAAAGVTRLICVGTDVDDSQVAVDFVQSRPSAWASIGIHPHEAQRYVDNRADNQAELERFAAMATRPKVVAIGECGLDFYYNHSPKAAQIALLRLQIELALAHDLPLIFHVRDAFEDFWPIFDEYASGAQGLGGPKLRGVIHSFSATNKELDQILQRGLYVGVNGIATFTKDPAQLAAYKAVPADRMLLETDAPYLTPSPYRGNICEPKHALTTLSFVAQLQGTSQVSQKESEGSATESSQKESLGEPSKPNGQLSSVSPQLSSLADQTTNNACRLFGLRV